MAQLIIGNVKFHIEIPTVLLFFAFMVSGSVESNLILYRTCAVTLGYNATECRELITNLTDNSTKELEDIVQIHATYVITVLSVIENTIPSVLCLFFGPWSDKYGRKPAMVLSICAFLVAALSRAVISAIPSLSPWYLLVSSVCAVITGGFASLFTSMLCYITDVSSSENRGLRMGLLEGTMALGIFSGTMSSSYIFNAVDFVGVYLVSAVCLFLALLYIIFLVPESIQNSSSFKTKAKDLFHFEHIVSMTKTTFKRREYYQRAVLMCVLAILLINVLNITGDGSILYLYIREKFHWNLQHYTMFSAGKSVGYVFGAIVGVYVLHKLLHVPELILIIIGFISLSISLVVQGLATKDWHLYLAGSIRSLASVLTPMLRSLISKSIPAEEIGKIFPFTIAGESFVSLIGSPLYTAIYDLTLKTCPGAFNFFTAGLNFINLIFTVIIIVLRRYQPVYNPIEVSTSINS